MELTTSKGSPVAWRGRGKGREKTGDSPLRTCLAPWKSEFADAGAWDSPHFSPASHLARW